MINKTVFVLVPFFLFMSCLPYIEKSVEYYGVKGQLAYLANEKIEIRIDSIESNHVSPLFEVVTDAKGNFVLEVQTKRYLTYTISGPILAPPKRLVQIKLFHKDNLIREIESEEVNGYFDLGLIENEETGKRN